VKQWTSK